MMRYICLGVLRPGFHSSSSPLLTLGAACRPGQRENLTRHVSLLGLRAHLTAPVIGKRAGLIWMHVIRPLLPAEEIAFSRRLLPDFR